MLNIQSHSRAKATKDLRIGLALAGGGPLGGIYELGALRALEDALDGFDLNNLEIYVGVSSGALLSAALANRIAADQIQRILIDSKIVETLFAPKVFLRPAFAEYYRRAKSIPELFARSVLRFIKNPGDLSFFESLTGIVEATPTGVFDNEIIDEFLTKLFALEGTTNDFRHLGTNKLFVTAVDLETSQSVLFGANGYDHVSISKAVQASTALPGLYPPVEIDGRYYVDGVLRKTLHASAALDEGATLVLCINPLVPFNANLADVHENYRQGKLIDMGLPVTLAQTFRTLIHSRLEVAMSRYSQGYKQADIILLEPDAGDSQMFFNNVFSYANRSKVCELAYQTTRRDLLVNSASLEPILKRHNISINKENLSHPKQFPEINAECSKNPDQAEIASQVTDKLSEILDHLEDWVKLTRRGQCP